MEHGDVSSDRQETLQEAVMFEWYRDKAIVGRRIERLERLLKEQGIISSGAIREPISIRGEMNHVFDEIERIHERYDLIIEHLGCKEITTKAVRSKQKLVCKKKKRIRGRMG